MSLGIHHPVGSSKSTSTHVEPANFVVCSAGENLYNEESSLVSLWQCRSRPISYSWSLGPQLSSNIFVPTWYMPGYVCSRPGIVCELLGLRQNYKITDLDLVPIKIVSGTHLFRGYPLDTLITGMTTTSRSQLCCLLPEVAESGIILNHRILIPRTEEAVPHAACARATLPRKSTTSINIK